MIVFPLTAFLMDAVGSWRTTLLIVAVAVTAITLLVSFIVKEKPDEDTARQLAERAPPLASGDGKHALAPQKILSTREFWLIAIPAALLLGVDQSVLATLAPYMQDRGFLTVQTATIMSSITASAICGKLFFAWVADRIDLRILMASTALVTIVQCIALMLAPGYVPLLIVCLLTGVAIGGTYPLANALIVQQFGPASAGTAVGMYSPIMSFCASAGLYFIGAVFDRNGDYSFGFMTFAGVATLAIIMLLLIRRRPRGNATAHPIQQEAPTAT
jgi:sugar phosphate permease